MADLEKAITTQEQLDEVIKDRLAREAKKYEGYISPKEMEDLKAIHAKQIEDLNKAAEADRNKVAKYEKDIAERDTKIKGYETDSVKTRIALSTGLPYGMAARLTGETEEDIKRDAEALKAMMGNSNIEPPLADPETPITKENANDAALKGMLQKLTN